MIVLLVEEEAEVNSEVVVVYEVYAITFESEYFMQKGWLLAW